MKALVCGSCDGGIDIVAIPPHGACTCRCGNACAWWTNPVLGIAQVYARDRTFVRILGLHNGFLIPAISEVGPYLDKAPAWWQALHEQATDAPGYVFDRAGRGCWAAIIKIGATSDVTWASAPYKS